MNLGMGCSLSITESESELGSETKTLIHMCSRMMISSPTLTLTEKKEMSIGQNKKERGKVLTPSTLDCDSVWR
jgi:hypothetical protein